MKVFYCDESGTGDEPIAVLVGVVKGHALKILSLYCIRKGKYKYIQRFEMQDVSRCVFQTQIPRIRLYPGNIYPIAYLVCTHP